MLDLHNAHIFMDYKSLHLWNGMDFMIWNRIGTSVRNNGRSTATWPAVMWQDQQLLASTSPCEPAAQCLCSLTFMPSTHLRVLSTHKMLGNNFGNLLYLRISKMLNFGCIFIVIKSFIRQLCNVYLYKCIPSYNGSNIYLYYVHVFRALCCFFVKY